MKKATAIPSKKARTTGNIPVKDPLRGFECYLKANNITNKGTLKEYLYVTKQFIAYLDGKPLSDITKTDVMEFVVKLKEHYKHNSMIPRCAGLRQLMRFLDKDIDVKIPSSLETRTEENVLTQEEIQQLFQVTANSPRDNSIIKTLYYSGLRRSELVALNIEDIDFQRKQITVKNGKGRNGQAEIINISNEALQSIQLYIKTRHYQSEALFLTDFGKRISVYGVQRILDRVMRKTTIQKHVTAHVFRASLITHMSQMGANTFHIQQQSRHKTLVSLKRYIRPNEKERLQNYQTYVPQITNTGITAKEPQEPEKKPEPKKPEPKQDPMVGSNEDKIRMLELENENLRLKLLAKSNPEKETQSTYFQ